MAERLIELCNIAMSFGRVYALGGVNLGIDKGEVVGLVGDNGAGKSTSIKILAGVVKPTAGEILVRGERVSGWSAARARGGDRDRLPGPRPRRAAIYCAQHLHGA
jgi:simple sugar transport system ATP-binding protein